MPLNKRQAQHGQRVSIQDVTGVSKLYRISDVPEGCYFLKDGSLHMRVKNNQALDPPAHLSVACPTMIVNLVTGSCWFTDGNTEVLRVSEVNTEFTTS